MKDAASSLVSDVGRYVIIQTLLDHTFVASGTPVGNSIILTRNFSSAKLPTQSMTYPSS
jgi:hypothetical protein